MLRSLVSRSKLATFAYRYVTNLNDRYLRQATIAIDGPSFVKRRLWKRYLTPDPGYVPIAMAPTFERHLSMLREQGICYIEGFADVATRLTGMLDAMRLTNYRRVDRVTDFEIDVGFAVPEVMRMLAHPDLCALFCNYYGRQAYYREHPLIVGMSAGAPGVDRSSSQVHCDGYRQITLHLLLNDVAASDTHLVYYAGTHKQPKVDYTRVNGNAAQVAGVAQSLGVGRAGTLILFDSGSGYHQGRYLPGQRLLLSGVVTTGWLPFRDRAREDLDTLRAMPLPAHVRGMFERR